MRLYDPSYTGGWEEKGRVRMGAGRRAAGQAAAPAGAALCPGGGRDERHVESSAFVVGAAWGGACVRAEEERKNPDHATLGMERELFASLMCFNINECRPLARPQRSL